MTAASPTILATCGGLNPGTWSDAVYGPLVLYAIELAGVAGRAPKVCHINTAGGDQRFVEGQELEAARLAGVAASHLRFFPKRNVQHLDEHLLSQDVIWVSGGSLVNLLAVWRAHGLPDVLRRAWQAGVVLAGGSAGALCWMSGGTTQSFGPDIAVVDDGLGFIPASLAVHYDSDDARRPAYHRGIATGALPSGYAIDEGVGLVFDGTALRDVVTETAGQRAFAVSLDASVVHEQPLAPRLIA
ncbi:peptidase E [soil metagenome]